MTVRDQAQADLPRSEFLSARGGAELFGAEAIAAEDMLVPVTSGSGTQLPYWDGGGYVLKPVKRWNGTEYVPAVLKRWDGSNSVPV